MALAKGLSVYMNGVSLGCALTSLDASASTDALDSTTLCQSARTYETGLKTGTLSASGIWDYDQTTLDKIHNVFSTAYDSGSENSVCATLAAIAVGVDAIMVTGCQSSYNVEVPMGQLVVCSAEFQATSGINYGKIAFNAAVNNTTTNGTALDNGASSTNGGLFMVQAQNPSEYAGSIKLQQSTDNNTWADISGSTLTLTGTGKKYEALYVELSGTVQRYVRAVATASTGSITFVAAFARR